MTDKTSTLGQLLANNARLNDIRAQLSTLQIQLSSGKKSSVYSGLKDQGIVSARTRVTLNELDVYQSNIAIGGARIGQVLQNVREFMQQAKNIADTLSGELQKGEDLDIANIRAAVRDSLDYLRKLINTKDSDRYILSGADSYTEPLTDTGAHAAYMTQLVSDWRAGTITTATMISSYSTTPETTIGYNPAMASDLVRNVYVRADVSTEINTTLLADSEGFKDVLNALQLMERMDLDKVTLEPDDPIGTTTAPGATADEQKDNFYQLYEDLIKRVNGGVNKLRSEEERLQRAELQLLQIEENHITDRFTFETTLGQVEDIDPADVAVRITALQTQLESAYQTTAILSTLSLVRFIGS